MYKPGYLPNVKVTISGLKSYRNNGAGIFLHKVRTATIFKPQHI